MVSNKKLSHKFKMPLDESLKRLSAFLIQNRRPEQTLRLPQLQGFLFAVSGAPYEIEAEDWLPVIFNEQEPAFQSDDEADAVLEVVMALYNYLDQQIEERKVALPDNCLPAEAWEDNFAKSSPFRLWCSGFLIGHGWLDECWEGLEEALDEEIGSAMMVMSFYAERELAVDFHADYAEPDESFEVMAEAMLAEFDEAMVRYADIGAMLRSDNEQE